MKETIRFLKSYRAFVSLYCIAWVILTVCMQFIPRGGKFNMKVQNAEYNVMDWRFGYPRSSLIVRTARYYTITSRSEIVKFIGIKPDYGLLTNLVVSIGAGTLLFYSLLLMLKAEKAPLAYIISLLALMLWFLSCFHRMPPDIVIMIYENLPNRCYSQLLLTAILFLLTSMLLIRQ